MKKCIYNGTSISLYPNDERNIYLTHQIFIYHNLLAQSAWAVEYTNWFSAYGLDSPPKRVSCYDTKQSEVEVPILLDLWGMQSTPSLPLLPGPFWPGVVAPGRVLSVGQIELLF